jgi:DNA-directed RNA polymerase specialized sigma subunit
MPKREFPYDPLEGLRGQRQTVDVVAPDTIMAALQQAGPGNEPNLSKEERQALQDVVLDALGSLEEIELWLINALLFERMSLRQVEYVLQIPKTTVARKRDHILDKLKSHLFDHPLIREYLSDGH